MPKTQQVLFTPSPETVVKPRTYSEEQLEQIKALREFSDTLILPESDPYHVWEKRWLDKWDTVPRYMRSAKWKLENAKKRLQGTIMWRREFKPELIPPEEVRVESETGKILFNGFDRDGRPIIYIRPGHENTQSSPRQLRHMVWWLERAKDMQPEGQDTVVILIDYKTATLKSNPSISTGLKVLAILQDHYVETLGRGLIVNLPFILSFFYKGISPFLDPITRDKIRFNPDLSELISPDQLDAEFGGSYEFEFEHKSYWEQVVNHCGIAPDGTRIQRSSSQNPEGSIIEKSTPVIQEDVISQIMTKKIDKVTQFAEKTKLEDSISLDQTPIETTA